MLDRSPAPAPKGKVASTLDNFKPVIAMVANTVPLVSTSDMSGSFPHPAISWIGHQRPKDWLKLLATSKFLLGLGDPLLGPSAIECIAYGCVYINPIYAQPVRDIYLSQHPYAESKIGAPSVCSYHVGNEGELMACVNGALAVDLPAKVPEDFLWDNYLQRVKNIFEL